MRFSERIGKHEIKVNIQLDSMDFDLRNSLWNVIVMHIIDPMKRESFVAISGFQTLIYSVWFSLFKEPIDRIPQKSTLAADNLRARFFEWDYLFVYDFLDFVASQKSNKFKPDEFIKACNFVLKRELSGYRFVSKKLSPIIKEEEIQEVEKAISNSASNNLKGVNIHLTEALNKLSDKQSPDYRNSIKESISAVESICQQISGDSNAELGKTLKKLKTILPIHGSLEQGFIKLYGYTSDGDGIRHAMMDEPNLDQEDAIYMLVSCSSFINYLITKANKLGVEIE